MAFITLDFETYYGDGLGFKTQTNEEYLRDPRFEVIGVSVKVDNETPIWFSGSHQEIKDFLMLFDWENSAVLAHNMAFDGAILAWHYGIIPAFYYDTLCMARAVHGVDAGGSLKYLAEYYGIGKKGDEVVNAYNKRRQDFTADELDAYGEYCINDVELTYKLFEILHDTRPIGDTNVFEQFRYLGKSDRPKEFSEKEFELINMTLRMYIHPTLMVDDALLGERLKEIATEKRDTLLALTNVLNIPIDGDEETGLIDAQEEVRKRLSSNQKFAEILRELGIEPPMKPGKPDKHGTERLIFAFAKTDGAFIELQEHPEPVVQQLCAARLGTKSTMEESRILRFREIGGRNRGYLPVPLKYYGAHTGRWAGEDKINFQNLPSRDKRKKALKNAVVAPPGHVIINCDSSQIEARVLAWMAEDTALVNQFRQKQDVYSIFATDIFKRQITKADAVERFVGKTCVAEGTLVLCKSGWKPIEQVTPVDRVWDGEEWVCHSGVVSNGTKETLQISGLWLTPDHLVWSGTQWLRADYVSLDANILSQTLDIGAENLPSQAMWPVVNGGLAPSLLSVTVDDQSTHSTRTIFGILNQLAATYALKNQQLKNAIGNTLRRCLTTHTERASLIVWQQLSHAATLPATAYTDITESEAYMSAMDGGPTEQRSCVTSNLWMDGINPNTRWTELMSMGHMRRGISGSSLAQKIFGTKEKYRTLKPVFDILNCGSRNRFTVLTKRGPIIVHNCILGLGYGTGGVKLQHTLKTQPPGAIMEIAQCLDIVRLYRDTHRSIPQFWQLCEFSMADIAAWPEGKNSYWLNNQEGVVEVTPEGFRLPNGLYIRYPNLRRDAEPGRIGTSWYYDSRKGVQKLWGGTITENIIQALARIIVGEQMINIDRRYRVSLTVHDAAVCVVPEAEVDEAVSFILDVMSTPPAWAKGLPVACEASWGISYGDPIGKKESN